MSRAPIFVCLVALCLPACETQPPPEPSAAGYTTPEFPPKFEMPPIPGMPDVPQPAPSPPADLMVAREKVELIGYGVGPVGPKGRERAIDRALRVIVQQASGMAFRYDAEGDDNYIQTSMEGYIQKYEVVKEVRVGDQQVIVLKARTQVELPAHDALLQATRTVTAPPAKLDHAIGKATTDLIRELVGKHRPGQATVQGLVYMTGMFVEVGEGAGDIEVKIPFVVLLEE